MDESTAAEAKSDTVSQNAAELADPKAGGVVKRGEEKQHKQQQVVDGTIGACTSEARDAKEADGDMVVVAGEGGAVDGGEVVIQEDKPWDTDTYRSLPKASDGRQLRETRLALPTPRPEDTVPNEMKDSILPMVAKTRRDLLNYEGNTSKLANAVKRENEDLLDMESVASLLDIVQQGAIKDTDQCVYIILCVCLFAYLYVCTSLMYTYTNNSLTTLLLPPQVRIHRTGQPGVAAARAGHLLVDRQQQIRRQLGERAATRLWHRPLGLGGHLRRHVGEGPAERRGLHGACVRLWPARLRGVLAGACVLQG